MLEKENNILGFLVDEKSKTISISNIKAKNIVTEIRITLKMNQVKNEAVP